MFEDAKSLREDIGDEAFFQKLNKNKSSSSKSGGWGSIAAGWDGQSFDIAVASQPGDKERTRLVGDLIDTIFRSYHNVAMGQDEAYLDLDKGLAVISQHAQSLGYDGLILFLDELILWLASHAADINFIHHETQKLVKLVEGQSADRPIPIVSFVARQRDLRKLIGDTVPGAHKLNFDDSVDWSDGRFGVVKLEDRNLPMIANKRVLKPRNQAARQELDAAFEKTATIRKEVMDTLLANEYDREMFRLIYPFSPALMETLIAASSMLQRERTALKVMMQLLVEQQDTLQVGDIVPVGDLYDAVAQGDEAFSQDMKIHFDNARKLYHEKLLPMLEATHGRRDEVLGKPKDDSVRINFINDDRLIKTLLLAALVPGVNSLRLMNANRLAALNHGTIRSPIPSKEPTIVLQKVKDWASQVGEIKIERDAPNPTISIQLSGVDTEAIIAAAEHEDNPGNQMRMVRQILFNELQIDNADQMFITYPFLWRNTSRECDVIYGNVRSLPDTSLTANGQTWKVVIDYPFDEPGHTTRDDLGKLQIFSQNNPNGTRTLVWLPAFFTESARRDLSRLVIIDHILTGERYNSYASFLSPQDRATARTLMENQRSSLQERVKQHVEAAYGIRGSQSKSIDDSHTLADTYNSLFQGLDLQPPAGSNLKLALEELLSQALSYEFPAHPSFGAEIKISNLRKVYEEVSKAVSEKGGRIQVDKSMRSLIKQIAEPLNLGEQGETHFVLGMRWKDHFNRKASESGTTITVQALRKWLDEPYIMGLPKDCSNLIILIYAAQTNRSFYRHGGTFDATLANLPEEVELREQQLPPATMWVTAIERASRIFGVVSSPLLNASNLTKLAEGIQAITNEKIDSCRRLVDTLKNHLVEFEVSIQDASRLQTAITVINLLEAVRNSKPASVIEALATFDPITSEAAMGTSFSSAAVVVSELAATQWKLFDSVRSLQDDRSNAAKALCQRVIDAMKADQHVTVLGPVLKIEQSKAIDLLSVPTVATPMPPVKTSVAPIDEPSIKRGYKMIDSGKRENISLAEAETEIERIKKKVKSSQTIRINVSWVIEE